VEEVGVALGTMGRFWNQRNMKKIEELKLGFRSRRWLWLQIQFYERLLLLLQIR
jgi:hypothetical protein